LTWQGCRPILDPGWIYQKDSDSEILLFQVEFLLSMAYKIPTQKSTYTIPKQPTATAVAKASTQVTTKTTIPSVPAVAQPALSSIAPGINSVADIGKVGQQKVVSTSEGSVTLQRIDDNRYYYIKSDNKGGYISEVRTTPAVAAQQVKVDSPVVSVSKQVATPSMATKFTITPPTKAYTIPVASTSYKIPEKVETIKSASKSSAVPTVPSVTSSSVIKQSSVRAAPAVAQPALSTPVIKTAKIKSVLQKIYPKSSSTNLEQVYTVKSIPPVPDVELDMSTVTMAKLESLVPTVTTAELESLVPILGAPATESPLIEPEPRVIVTPPGENVYSGYIDTSPGEDKILSSFQQSLAKYYDTWPEYVDGKQECIQDAAYAMNNWRNDLASDDDPSNDNWYQYARLVTAKDDWHAMVVVSPGGLFANPKKDHIFDPRYNAYRGTISNYDNKEESELGIWSKFKTVSGSVEILADNESRRSQIFVPNSESESEDFKPGSNSDEVSRTKIDIAERGMIDNLTGAALLSGKPYYQSKLDPNLKYNEETYNLLLDASSKQNMQKINPDGTIDTKLKVQSVDISKPAIIKVDNTVSGSVATTTVFDDYALLKSVYGTDKTTDLVKWALSDANPVRYKKYITGSYQCLQFARDFVKASRDAGFDTYIITLDLKDNNNKNVPGHAMVGLKIGDNIYEYDPLKNIDMALSQNWELLNPMYKISESLIDIPILSSKYDDSVSKIIISTPSFIEANETINQKIADGEFTTIDAKTITVPILSVVEPQIRSDKVVSLENIDSATTPESYGFVTRSVRIIKSPDQVGPDGSTQIADGTYQAYVTSLDPSMTTKQVAFALAKQIYGEDFSIPQMVDIYQFVQKYSTDGKFDVSKLGEINKDLGSTLKIQEAGSFSVLPSGNFEINNELIGSETFIPLVWDAKTGNWIEDPGLAGNSIKTIISGSDTEIPKSYIRNENSKLVNNINVFVNYFYEKDKRPDGNDPLWMCIDYAKMMVDAAKKVGLPAYMATGIGDDVKLGENINHAFVAFDLSGRMDLLEDYIPSDTSKLGLYAPQEFILYEPQSNENSYDNVPGRDDTISKYNHIDIHKNPIYYLHDNYRSGVMSYNENVLRFKNVKYSDIEGNDATIVLNEKFTKIDDFLTGINVKLDTDNIVGDPVKKGVM